MMRRFGYLGDTVDESDKTTATPRVGKPVKLLYGCGCN